MIFFYFFISFWALVYLKKRLQRGEILTVYYKPARALHSIPTCEAQVENLQFPHALAATTL